MDEYRYTRIIIKSGQSASYYSEQEMADSCHLDLVMVRRLRTVGLIQGIETTEGESRYSEEDVARLRRIRRLHRDLGVNLAGIEVILRLEAQIEALQRELEQFRS